jgi:hypothetical protein
MQGELPMIKNRTAGPKFGGVGSTNGAPKGVGTTGPDKSSTSSAGGQHSFLPSPKAYATKATISSGQSTGGRGNHYSHLPMKLK